MIAARHQRTAWRRAHADLSADPEAYSWQERLDLATAIGRQLAHSNREPEAIALAIILAHDPAPEIRKTVAEAIIHLDEENFIKLAALLSTDDNAFVKTAAMRAIRRRQRNALQVQRTRRNLGVVARRVSSFEGTYGSEATRRLRRIADAQFTALVLQNDHDLRQILSPIRTSITTLSRQFDASPDRQFCRNTLQAMGRRMDYIEQFLSDLREYAKAGVAERCRERLIEIAREAKKIADSAVRRNGIKPDRIKVQLDIPETLTVLVARHQTVLALVHLIRNAIEAFHEPGSRRRNRHVIVTAVADPHAVTVTVTDNACGLHPEDLELLREFVPGKHTQKPNGTGFGLPTAARYIEAQGGTLQIDSTQGHGTTLTLTFPQTSEDDE